MGKGLEIRSEGVHVAVTAGTGVLVFLDLVAHLIRKNLGLLSEEEDSQLSTSEFRFILYASFGSVEESLGYDLCKGLDNMCRQKGLTNFEYYVRFRQDEQQRSTTQVHRWERNSI